MDSYVKHLPTLPSVPLLGNAHYFIGKSTVEIFSDIIHFIKSRGTPTKIWIGPCLTLTLDKPEDFKTVLMSPNCLDKPYMYQFMPSDIGILTAKSGAVWKPMRKLMNPCFNMKILQSFVPIFNEKTNLMLSKLDVEVNAGVIDIAPYMFACTLDMVCATTMGYNVDVQKDNNLEFLKGVEVLCETIGKRFVKVWCHPDIIFKLTNMHKVLEKQCDIMDTLTSKIRNIKKAEYKKNLEAAGKYNTEHIIDEEADESYKTPQVLIDKLLQLYYGGQFTEKIVKEQIETVVIAGNETSALTLSYVLLMLAMHPHIQERVYDELRSVYDTQTEDSTYEQIQKLPYLDSVLKEGMRLFPVAPFLVRTVCADIQLSNCTAPKDAFIMLSLYNLHRNEQEWGPNADDFDPDNFLLSERVSARHPYSFLPFSGGPRNCIGLQYAMISMKIALAGLLRQFKYTTNLKRSDLVMRFELTLKLDNKHMVALDRRAW